MIIKKVTLNNKSRKGDYIYIKQEGYKDRYYKTSNISLAKEYYINRYVNKKIDISFTTFRKGIMIQKDYYKGKKLSDKELKVLNRYVVNTQRYRKVEKRLFRKELERNLGKDNIIDFNDKLRDDRGKKVILRNNRYRVVTYEKPDNFMSQYVGEWKFTIRLTINKRKRVINKSVFGYANMVQTQRYEKNELRKITRDDALSRLLRSIGFNNGSKRIDIRQEKLVREFYISYLDYSQILNENVLRGQKKL